MAQRIMMLRDAFCDVLLLDLRSLHASSGYNFLHGFLKGGVVLF